MNLANDIARCSGKHHAPPAGAWPFPAMERECMGCRRRTDRSNFPQQAWMGPPDESPCPMRIAPEGKKNA